MIRPKAFGRIIMCCYVILTVVAEWKLISIFVIAVKHSNYMRTIHAINDATA